ncbi:ComF family protein [bacterium]|nr:ComF family protein [bacterium]
MIPTATESALALSELGRALVNLLFPPLCVVCRQGLCEDEEEICRTCRNRFTELPLPACRRCAAPLPPQPDPYHPEPCRHCPPAPVHFDAAGAALLYDGAAADALCAYKFRFRRRLARVFVPPMIDAVERLWTEVSFTAVVPVPLHRARQRWREFNQSELLAQGLCEARHLSLVADAVVRVKRTPPQSRYGSHARRRSNIAGAFRVENARPLEGGCILIVDDIMTSGATVNELARVLKEAGAGKVFVLTAARAVGHRPA